MFDKEEKNINKLVLLLKARLSSEGKQKTLDTNGNVVYVDCNIFSNDILVQFLTLSLAEFNQTPSFTAFNFGDTEFTIVFSEILVEGATLYALSSKALIERGREFTIEDNGIGFRPPSVAEMLNTQFQTLLSHHFEKLKLIKSRITEFKK